MEPGPINAVLRHIRRLAAVDDMSHLSDGQLLQRFLASREEAAFAALLERHGPMVWRVCHRVLGHRHNAEDVFQATFLTLARKTASIRKAASVACWLHGVSYRLARRLQAKLARQRCGQARPADDNPADKAGSKELQAVLDDELAQLAEKYRLPLVLCYLEGQTRDEAAGQLGWSLSTFKRRLDRARTLLAARLTRRGLSLGVALWTGGLLADTDASAMPALIVPKLSLGTRVCHAAGLIAAGKTVAGIVSPRALALTEGMVTSMMITKLKRVAAVLLAVVFLAGGVGLWTARQMEAAQPPSLPHPSPPTPLPDGERGRGEGENQGAGKAQPKGDNAAFIKRGDYLVNVVARCGDCHTPRNKKGELDMSRHLQGASMWFTPKVKGKGEWEDDAPDITSSGLANRWGEDKMVKFLSTGAKSERPMPAYNLTVEDAQAVTAYLRSLAGKKKEGTGKKKEKDRD
jgi:RNA polymerase sigma factor (sigma-70 family)